MWLQARGGDSLIKQADTVLMYYPLAVNATDSVRRNDVLMYAKLQNPHGGKQSSPDPHPILA